MVLTKDVASIVGRVFFEFARHLERSGKKFIMSHRLRGLCHVDQYGTLARVRALNFEDYLRGWGIQRRRVSRSLMTNLMF
jgi:hypothetical protein